MLVAFVEIWLSGFVGLSKPQNEFKIMVHPKFLLMPAKML